MNKLIVIVALLMLSCNAKKTEPDDNIVLEKIALLKVDREFSALCEAKGMRNAFIEYMDSNGVLLRTNHLPIIGAKAIDYLLEQDDNSYTLKWQPRNAVVANSADFGYTYGIWALQPKNQDTVMYGTYVSIWKKQGNGKWKFVLDAGNDGIGTEE